MLLRLAYLGVTNVFALLRLMPVSSRDKDAEILCCATSSRSCSGSSVQTGCGSPRVIGRCWRGWRTGSRDVFKRLHLVVRPDTVLRWNCDLVARRHAKRSWPRHPGRPRTVRSIRILVLRLVRENPGWGYRRVHGELLMLGVKVAASTVWEILHDAGIDPAPKRSSTTWADFCAPRPGPAGLGSFEAVTLSGVRLHVLAVIEHAGRRIRILGATAHPTASWMAQAARNLVMDLLVTKHGESAAEQLR